MNKDYGQCIAELKVDGGMTANSLLMQLQADLAGITVVKPNMAESTALGAAMVAGAAVGYWNMVTPLILPSRTWSSRYTDDERDVRYSRWKMAVERAMGWSI